MTILDFMIFSKRSSPDRSPRRLGFFGFVGLLIGCSFGCLGCGSATAGSSTSGGGGGVVTPPPVVTTRYGTTSNIGDFGQWTITGSNLSASIDVTDSCGNTAATLSLSATCGSTVSDFGYQVCTASTFSCALGTAVPGCTVNGNPTASCASLVPANPSGTQLAIFPEQGLALFAFLPNGTGGYSLHSGYALSNNCGANLSGDYTYSRTGWGTVNLFGIIRSDATLTDVVHADFRPYSTSEDVTPFIAYDTSGTGAITFTPVSCTNGVMTLSYMNNGVTNLVNAFVTTDGLLLIDLPSGQGGLLAFNTSLAANLSDFQNLTFGGLSFPDNSGTPNFVATTTAGVSTDADGNPLLPLGAIITQVPTGQNADTTTVQTGMYLKAAATPDSTTTGSNDTGPSGGSGPTGGPGLPDYTQVPSPTPGNPGSSAYADNVLSATYPAPAAVPGLIKLGGDYVDGGRVVMSAMNVPVPGGGNMIVAMGSTYNWRTDNVPSGTLQNTGNFIVFSTGTMQPAIPLVNAVNPSNVNAVSMFNSCEGHAYPENTSPNSAKNYFYPNSTNFNTNDVLPEYAMCSGTVSQPNSEASDQTRGQTITLFCDNSSTQIRYFHVNVNPSLETNLLAQAAQPPQAPMHFNAGDQLGYAYMLNGTATVWYTSSNFDIAVSEGNNDNTEDYFSKLTPAAFAAWASRGVTSVGQSLKSPAPNCDGVFTDGFNSSGAVMGAILEFSPLN